MNLNPIALEYINTMFATHAGQTPTLNLIKVTGTGVQFIKIPQDNTNAKKASQHKML